MFKTILTLTFAGVLLSGGGYVGFRVGLHEQRLQDRANPPAELRQHVYCLTAGRDQQQAELAAFNAIHGGRKQP